MCQVQDCGGIGKNVCRSKSCFEQNRKYCDTHYKGGGHKNHNGKQLKPYIPKVSKDYITLLLSTVNKCQQTYYYRRQVTQLLALRSRNTA